MDAAIRRITVEKVGPVRTAVPYPVLELGFEGIQASPRHIRGIAVRFPRMLRWRAEKPLHEADTRASPAALPGATDPPIDGMRLSAPAGAGNNQRSGSVPAGPIPSKEP